MTALSASAIWVVIALMAVANFVLRFVPIAVVSRRRLPAIAQRWLSYVPVSVMAALVAGEVLRPGGEWLPLGHNPYLLAALPTALAYRLRRSLLGATLVGVACFLGARWLLGLV